MSQSVLDALAVQPEAAAAKVLTLGASADLSTDAVRDNALTILEGGGSVLLPETGFALSARETELVGRLRMMLSNQTFYLPAAAMRARLHRRSMCSNR